MESTTLDIDKVERETKWPTLFDVMHDRRWQVMALISVVALIFVYWRAFEFWWLEWWKKESHYSHGVLIPFMSAFLIWFNWKSIARTPVEPTALGLIFLIPAILLQFVTNRAEMSSVAGMTLPIVLLGLVLLVFGKRLAVYLLFPIVFLFFMCVPPSTILEQVSFRIQIMSTTAATIGLKLLGFSAQQHGSVIQLPSINVEVGAPCSGFRMLIALLAFATFFAYMKVGPLWGRLSLIAFVLPLSLIANSIRVLLIAVVGEYWGRDAMHSFHDYSGYIVLVIAFLILILLSRVVKCRDFKSMPA